MAQPAPAPGTVIEVNGLRFAKAPRRSIAKLQGIDPLPGFDGWFKAGVSGVLLMRPNGEPFAFASANDCGFLVSAHLWRGQVRYLFSTTEREERTLGITGYAQGNEVARSILDQAGVTLRRLAYHA